MKKTVTTVKEYDADGKIVKETVTEVTESASAPVFPKRDKTPWNGICDGPYEQNSPWREYWWTVMCNA